MFFVSMAKVFNNEGEFLYDIGTEGPGKLDYPSGRLIEQLR